MRHSKVITLQQKQQKHHHLFALLILSLSAMHANGAALRSSNGNSNALTQPNEVLPIQPLLIYPKYPDYLYEARNFDDLETEIIYVKLLPYKKIAYRPKPYEAEARSRELGMKDIFYVKANVNGAFSSKRLKVFRLPEFYAINVYHNVQE